MHLKAFSTSLLGVPSLLKNTKLRIGIGGFLVIIVLSVLSESLIPFDPTVMFRYERDLPPSSEHLLGTDGFGRDVLALIIPSIKNTFYIATLTAILSTFIAMIVGFCAGYYRNPLTSTALRWFIDAFMTLPSLPFVVLLTALLPTVNMLMISVTLALFGWAGGARAIMAQLLSIRERDFVQTLKMSGANNTEVFKDVSLNLLPYTIASFVNSIRGAMMTETGLSILGLGNQTTLGQILHYAAVTRAAVIRGLWWWWMPPVVVLSIILILLYLINMGFDEIIDPRLTGKR